MRQILCCVLATVCLSGCHSKPQEAAPEKSITILWAQWAPADQLQQLCQDFTAETGIKVIVKQAPWGHFFDEFFRSVKERTGEYDMVGGDSQWLGRGMVDGIYVDITQWMKARHVDEQMTEASIRGYAEYPAGSKRYWAIPLMGDAMGFAYRKDLFEDHVEKENFRLKYGYDLAVPKTWEQLRDIAEFFYRPDKGFYGVNVWASADYDAVTMGVESLVWAYGGNLGDYQTFRVKGILNTPETAKGLKMYKIIHQFGAPEWKSAYLDANDAFIAGKVAMVMSYFAFFPDLNDPKKNSFAAVTGYFANPAGPNARVASLGGQGLSLLSVTKKKESCFKFLEWFIRPEVQSKWARLGGYSCDKAVLHSKEFLSATPYNPALTESMSMMRDFWVVPEYLELLAVSQKYWHQYLFSDEFTAEEANNKIASEWENIFEMAGYYKE